MYEGNQSEEAVLRCAGRRNWQIGALRDLREPAFALP